MDGWQVAQNYIVAGVIFGGLGGYYYYTTKQRTPNRTRASTAPVAKRGEADARARGGSDRRVSARERDASEHLSSDNAASHSHSPAGPRKRKVRAEQSQTQAASTVTRDEKPEKEADTSTAQFARQMVQARQGANLGTTKSKESRVKTVKARPTEDTPVVTSATSPTHNGTETGAEADDEATPPTQGSRDVADMLEPSAPGPSSLRITAPSAPQKEKSARQPKAEVEVESKKQRQNRKKVEERRLQREEEEKQRKALEEKQRRSAREARGEPAKNGVATARPPVSNPWEQKNAANVVQVQSTAPAVTGHSHGPLLDTFDAESTGSSNGGMGGSTAATSTTEGEQTHWGGNLSEEEQVAVAIQQSGDLSGWTTVSAPKKSKKKTTNDDTPAAASSTENSKPINKVKPPTNIGKANGFSAFQADSGDGIEWEA